MEFARKNRNQNDTVLTNPSTNCNDYSHNPLYNINTMPYGNIHASNNDIYANTNHSPQQQRTFDLMTSVSSTPREKDDLDLKNALTRAVEHRNFKEIIYLFKQSLNQGMNLASYTLLLAVKTNFTELALSMLNDRKKPDPLLANLLNLNDTDHLGWTALHWAAACGERHVILNLLNQGADPLCMSNSGKTFVDLVLSSGKWTNYRELLVHLSVLDDSDPNYNRDLYTVFSHDHEQESGSDEVDNLFVCDHNIHDNNATNYVPTTANNSNYDNMSNYQTRLHNSKSSLDIDVDCRKNYSTTEFVAIPTIMEQNYKHYTNVDSHSEVDPEVSTPFTSPLLQLRRSASTTEMSTLHQLSSYDVLSLQNSNDNYNQTFIFPTDAEILADIVSTTDLSFGGLTKSKSENTLNMNSDNIESRAITEAESQNHGLHGRYTSNTTCTVNAKRKMRSKTVSPRMKKKKKERVC
eukprot:Awhi_evm1s4284